MKTLACPGFLTLVLLVLAEEARTDKIEFATHIKDHAAGCDHGHTLCRFRNGDFACCRFKNAVCCGDELHCCPHGSQCDVLNKMCIHPSLEINNHISPRCPDAGTRCHGKCCPLEDAVCCSNGAHCCPKNYRCDLPNCIPFGLEI